MIRQRGEESREISQIEKEAERIAAKDALFWAKENGYCLVFKRIKYQVIAIPTRSKTRVIWAFFTNNMEKSRLAQSKRMLLFFIGAGMPVFF